MGAPERPPGPGGTSEMDSMWAWTRRWGVQMHEDIGPALVGGGELWGVVARRPLEADAVLMRVPVEALFPLDLNAESSPAVPAELLRSIPDNFFAPKVPAVQLARVLGGSCEPEFLERWRPYLERLRALVFWAEVPEFVDAFQQSPLRDKALYVGGWARRASGTPGGGSAPGLNRSLYLHAVRCLLSRVHGTDSKGGRALVPGGDMFNHHFLHNARWTYQAGPPGFFAVLAAKPIAEGQEVVISYGDDLSNEELMDQYGFTQAPYWEPFHTFFLFMEEAPDGSMRHPGFEISDKTRSLMLKTPIVIEGVGARNFPNEFLSFVDAHNSTWRDILRQHLEFHLRRYGSDASLELLVATWRANREQSPRTAVWWTPLPSCRSDYGSPAEDDSGGCAGERDLSAELAAGSFVAESVLRVKMTEYVALTAYSEMLDILEGRRDWRSALMSATGMADMLDFDLRRYRGARAAAAPGPRAPAREVPAAAGLGALAAGALEASGGLGGMPTAGAATWAGAWAGAACLLLARSRWAKRALARCRR